MRGPQSTGFRAASNGIEQFETLEVHGHPLVERAPDRGQFPGEEAAMPVHPVGQRAVAFALVPGESGVDLGERAPIEPRGAHDRPRHAVVLGQHGITARDGFHLRQPVVHLGQAGGCALGAVQHQFDELVRQSGRVAEVPGLVRGRGWQMHLRAERAPKGVHAAVLRHRVVEDVHGRRPLRIGVAHIVSENNSRPISIRRISDVPAPISYSFASRQRRPVG